MKHEVYKFAGLAIRKDQVSSERQFGIVFSVVFALLGIWFIFGNTVLGGSFLAIAVAFLGCGFFLPSILKPLNVAWVFVGLALGALVSPIIMAIVYFGVFFPTGILLRLTNRDPLRLKKSDGKSYWVRREEVDMDMKEQF